MKSQANYQQVHSPHMNMQGHPIQPIQNSCQVYSSKQNCVIAQQYPIQNAGIGGAQISQGYENSPSNRFLSSTARVLKNQIVDFKQMITPQHQQQNIINQQIIQGKQLNQNGVVQMHAQPFLASSKPGTPSSYQSIQGGQNHQNQINQGFGMVMQNYHRSSSANYNGHQNLVHYDSIPSQPTYITYLNSENIQNNGIDAMYNSYNKAVTPPSIPISPNQQQQKQQLKTQVVYTNNNSNNNAQVFDFIERRKSVEEGNGREDKQRTVTRLSDRIPVYKYSDSSQSNTATTNIKTAPVSTLSAQSNNSPLQLLDNNDPLLKNAQIHLINHPLQLEEPTSQNAPQFIQNYKQSLPANSQNLLNAPNDTKPQNTEEIVLISEYFNEKSENEKEQSRDKTEEQQTKGYLQQVVSQELINIYYQQQQQQTPSEQQLQYQSTSHKETSYEEISQNTSTKEIKEEQQISDQNNQKAKTTASKDSKTAKGMDSVQKNESGTKSAGKISQSLKSSPQSQTKLNYNLSSKRNHKDKSDQNSKTKGKSIGGINEIHNKLNPHQLQYQQYQEDSFPHKSTKEQRSQNTSSKSEAFHQALIQNLEEQKPSKQGEKGQQNQQLFIHHSISKSNRDIKVIAQSNSQNQMYTPLSSKKEMLKHHSSSKEYQIEKGTPHNYRIIDSSSRKKIGNSSARQITFPESPISVASKIDYSQGFGSDITYSEDYLNDHTTKSAYSNKSPAIPLVATLSQFQNQIQHKQQSSYTGAFLRQNNKSAEEVCLEERAVIKPEIKENVQQQQLYTKIRASGQEQEEEDQEANPNFINLYKTPQKSFTTNKNNNEIPFSTQQAPNQKGEELQTETQAKKRQDGQLPSSVTDKNQSNTNQQADQQTTQKGSEYNQQIKLSSMKNEIEKKQSTEEQSPFMIEIQKQHQRIIEGFGVKNQTQQKIDSKDDLALFNKESSSQSSPDAKGSQPSKSGAKKNKKEYESVQSISELLNFMGGLPPVSNLDFILNNTNNNLLTKQNLSLIFDEKSNLPSRVCSLKNIADYLPSIDENTGEQQMNKDNQIALQLINLQKTSSINAAASVNANINTKRQPQPQNNSKQQQQQQSSQKKLQTQKSGVTISQDKLKKSATLKRQDTPPINTIGQYSTKNSQQQPMQGGLKIQDLYIGQYSTKSAHQNNQRSENNQINILQSNQNKLRTANRKGSLIKAESASPNQQKMQGIINLQRNSQTAQQLIQVIQMNQQQPNDAKTSANGSNDPSSKSLVNINSSQKAVANQKIENKSATSKNGLQHQNSSNSSNIIQNNSSITNTTKKSSTTILKSQQSNLYQTMSNQSTKPTEGCYLAESGLRNNDDQTTSLHSSQREIVKKDDLFKGIKNNQQNINSQSNKKFFSNKNSFEDPDIESEYKNEHTTQINSILGQNNTDNQTNPYINYSISSRFKNAINIEDTYSALSRNSFQGGGMDTDRSLKSDIQVQMKKEPSIMKPSGKSKMLNKQHSLHESTQKQAEVIYNLKREGGRNSTNVPMKSNDMKRDTIEYTSSKSPTQSKNLQKEVPFSEFKVPRKKPEQQQNIALQNNAHYRRESYSNSKATKHTEGRERPSSNKKGAVIHHSVDMSIHDLIEEGEKRVSLETDCRKKNQTQNSPLIHSKNHKKMGYPLSASNSIQNLFSSPNGSYATSNQMKNQYYSTSTSKTNLNQISYETSINNSNQLVYLQSQKQNQKLSSNIHNPISNMSQVQKIQSLKKEDPFQNQNKQLQFDKMK